MDRSLIHFATGDSSTASFLDEWMSGRDRIQAHTSGSTGAPKRIWLDREAMRRSAAATNRFFGINSRSVMVCPLSSDYIAGKMMIVRAMEVNARLWMVRPSRTNLLDGIELSGIERIDLMPIVPSQIDAAVEASGRIDIVNVIVGGAAVSSQQEQQLASAGFNAWATYGMTETCSHVALRNISHGEKFFTALPGVCLGLDDRGCLVVDGLVTNDIVDLQDNRFVWLGRADNVINSGGVKLFPEQLESALRPHLPPDMDFYFSSRKSDLWGDEVVMVSLVELENPGEILSICRNVLPRAGVPKAIIYDDAPRFTSTGKLRRRRF